MRKSKLAPAAEAAFQQICDWAGEEIMSLNGQACWDAWVISEDVLPRIFRELRELCEQFEFLKRPLRLGDVVANPRDLIRDDDAAHIRALLSARGITPADDLSETRIDTGFVQTLVEHGYTVLAKIRLAHPSDWKTRKEQP